MAPIRVEYGTSEAFLKKDGDKIRVPTKPPICITWNETSQQMTVQKGSGPLETQSVSEHDVTHIPTGSTAELGKLTVATSITITGLKPSIAEE